MDNKVMQHRFRNLIKRNEQLIAAAKMQLLKVEYGYTSSKYRRRIIRYEKTIVKCERAIEYLEHALPLQSWAAVCELHKIRAY